MEKFNRMYFDCDAKNVPLQTEYVHQKSKGERDRVSNLTSACAPCNFAKGNKSLKEFVVDPTKRSRLRSQTKMSLRYSAAVNSTKDAIERSLKSTGLITYCWSGGRTKHNRVVQNYSKDPCIQASWVVPSGK